MIVAVSAILFDADDRVLLIRRADPPNQHLYTLPGGRLEADESIPAAVAREVREETGLLVDVGPLVHIVHVADFIIHAHLARIIPGGTLAAASDALDARFATPAELLALPTTPGLVAVIDRARATHRAWSARS